MIELIGWTAGILFALCGAPQAIKCWRDGHGQGLSHAFVWMWVVGEVLMQVYVFGKHGWDMPLLVNYWVNTVFVLVIMKYMYFPRGEYHDC